MKKYLLILTGVLFIACANTTEEKNSPSTLAASTQPADSKPADGESDVCGNQLYFKKGLELEATSYQGDGTVTRKDKTKITNVRSEGGITIAEAESTEITEGKKTDGKVLHYTYKCDGKYFYVDLSQILGSLDTKGTKINVSNVTFPINIKDGEQLPEASITMDMTYGNKTIKSKVTYKDRKVEGTETLTIPGKSWKCYKVSAILETEMMGLDEKTTQVMKAMQAKQPKMKSVMWFAPDAGVLRFDLYMGDDLKSYSQITAIKK